MRKIRERGITLIAMVITIVVLLILAGITIGAITGENGIINKTGQAKEDAEIANEKEIIDTSTVEAMGKNKRGNLVEDEFQSAIDKHTDGKVEVTDIGEEFEVYFTETNRYYMVDKDGNIGEAQEVVKDENPGDITVGKDGEQLDGSADYPYEIWCIEDLVALSNMCSGEGIIIQNGKVVQVTQENNFYKKYVVLKRDLNFKSRLSYENSERTDFGDINGNTEDGNVLIKEMQEGRGFKPIGLYSTGSRIFQGTFDGENHKISNIYINYEDDEIIDSTYNLGRSVGLFSMGVYEIKNLEISGEIKGAGHTGGITGYGNYNTTNIENCINRANISGKNMVGGIIGGSRGNVINCKNYGDIYMARKVYGYGAVGGIAGSLENAQIRRK